VPAETPTETKVESPLRPVEKFKVDITEGELAGLDRI
jgi:hypothetical protein